MKKLFFIHIPKTAGTSVSVFLGKNNLLDKTFRTLPTKFNIDVNNYHSPLNIYTDKSIDILKKVPTFVIVRNPIDKIVSAYNCKWYNIDKSFNYDSVKQFNNKIIEFIRLDENKKSYKFVKQYDYVYLNDEKIVDKIIKFENLKNGIENFMFELYGKKYIFEEHLNKKDSNRFNKSHLYDETIELITKHYRKDFKFFNYEI